MSETNEDLLNTLASLRKIELAKRPKYMKNAQTFEYSRYVAYMKDNRDLLLKMRDLILELRSRGVHLETSGDTGLYCAEYLIARSS